ncbi:hypothetical protein [Halobacillus faecis]|uniref:Uncharacterized protein n=1 Tax=Halobacillus faecis TaxID=360184 RepID=A0A511WQE9_9BACI|nr:hypothetical protein [Halobacillus faecis]GEN52493.1 hypothetical protein HFA01_07550 [Halobacillus faecis]
MTIQFLIFTITVAKNKKSYQPLPGYRPTAKDQWLDRKSAFSRYM